MLISFPHSPGSGGPGSFQTRFEQALSSLGWSISYAGDDSKAMPDVVLVVGGTRKLAWLHTMKRQGVPIVYRLDGLLWLHRVGGGLKTPIRWIQSEARNALAQWIHGRLADCVVYQSHFVKEWWRLRTWWQPPEAFVISNGIDLEEFYPSLNCSVNEKQWRDVVCVEGHVDYSPYSIDLLNRMVEALAPVGARLIVYGDFGDHANRSRLDRRIDYRGSIARGQVPEVYRGRVCLSLDVNPACPNVVAEALASGAPVIGFDTGSVKELVGETAGMIVPYGGDSWAGDFPRYEPLIEAYREVVGRFESFSNAARQRAEERFELGKMTDAYVQVIRRTIDKCKG